jgi:hypothetical protein
MALRARISFVLLKLGDLKLRWDPNVWYQAKVMGVFSEQILPTKGLNLELHLIKLILKIIHTAISLWILRMIDWFAHIRNGVSYGSWNGHC